MSRKRRWPSPCVERLCTMYGGRHVIADSMLNHCCSDEVGTLARASRRMGRFLRNHRTCSDRPGMLLFCPIRALSRASLILGAEEAVCVLCARACTARTIWELVEQLSDRRLLRLVVGISWLWLRQTPAFKHRVRRACESIVDDRCSVWV